MPYQLSCVKSQIIALGWSYRASEYRKGLARSNRTSPFTFYMGLSLLTKILDKDKKSAKLIRPSPFRNKTGLEKGKATLLKCEYIMLQTDGR